MIAQLSLRSILCEPAKIIREAKFEQISPRSLAVRRTQEEIELRQIFRIL